MRAHVDPAGPKDGQHPPARLGLVPARRLAEKLRLLAGPRRALGRQVGADLARTLRRRTVPAVMAVLLAVMTGALVLVNGLAATQDRAAVASTGRQRDTQ